MSYLDQNIVVVPNVGNANDTPKIVFSGANNTVNAQSISVRAYPVANGTVSFEGSAGQLFSITNQLTGTIFSVNDISGIPSIAVQDTGSIQLAPYNGDVTVGQQYDQGTGALQVTGNSTFNGAVTDKSLNLQGGNNLALYSGTLTNVVWSSVNGTNTTSSIIASNGTSYYQTMTATSGGSRYQQSVSTTSGYVYTLSFELYPGTSNYAGIVSGNSTSAGAIYNLSTGVVVSTAGTNAIAANISSKLSNGAYRCSLTFTAGGAVAYAGFGPSDGSTYNSTFYPSAASGTINGQLAQLELGSVASAYTPTTTAAITTTNNISVPSGQVLVQSGTTSLPSYSFTGATNTGMYYNGNLNFNILGSTAFYCQNGGGFWVGSTIGMLASGTIFWNSGDTALARDAANILAQRNTTNAQTFRLYNTYTDSSNYERLSVDWTTTANTATISTQNAGTGSARNLAFSGVGIVMSASGNIQYLINGYGVAALDSTGFRGYSDGTANIGSSASRFKNAYFSGAISTNTITALANTTSSNANTGSIVVTGGVGVSDSIYVGNRVGFANSNNISVVYQQYNSITNSLDTIFG